MSKGKNTIKMFCQVLMILLLNSIVIIADIFAHYDIFASKGRSLC